MAAAGTAATWLEVEPALITLLEQETQSFTIIKRWYEERMQFRRLDVLTLCKQKAATDRWHKEAAAAAPQGVGAAPAAQAPYRRYRKIITKTKNAAPDMKGAHGPLRTTSEKEEAYLQNRQDVCCHPPGMSMAAIWRWIPYAAKSERQQVQIPKLEEIEQTIQETPDTAPGHDGIPYAFFRLTARVVACLISAMRVHLGSCSLEDWERVPWQVQLLIWIAKIEGADTPEDMRPLALPESLMRIIASVRHKVDRTTYGNCLHPSQALEGDVKDPQWNFERAQHWLDTGEVLSPGGQLKCGPNLRQLRLILLADLNKAFERLGPAWVLLVLTCLRPPMWLFMTIATLLTGRKSRLKLGRALCAVIFMASGIDMVNGLSPWMFCLALDALIRRLHSIPRVCLVNAYMDDLQTGTIGARALRRVQEVILSFATVSGLTVRKHDCVQISNGRTLCKGAGYVKVAQTALRMPKDRHALWCLNGHHTTRRCTQKVKEKGPPTRWLYAKCKCKTKATLICSRRPHRAELLQLDSLPLGTKPLASRAISLGMDLFGAQLEETRERRNTLENQRLTPAISKLVNRAKAGMRSRRSITDSARFWNTYCLPCIMYSASYKSPTQKEADLLLNIRSRH